MSVCTELDCERCVFVKIEAMWQHFATSGPFMVFVSQLWLHVFFSELKETNQSAILFGNAQLKKKFPKKFNLGFAYCDLNNILIICPALKTTIWILWVM